jgi:Ca-activated chloride channel homolog
MFHKYTTLIIVILCAWTTTTLADGLMLPVDENYPKDFLQNRYTKIYVNLTGQVAETSVYQEFVNEGNKPTDAVYSFPLPPDARAVELLYWYQDTLYKAVLQVREQATNPGTGEGGIVALVNEYIGKNGIRLRLKDIQPGEIQKIQLYYISFNSYYEGKIEYQYPLDTQQFLTYPIDLLTVEIVINSNRAIQSYDLMSHPGWEAVVDNPNKVIIKLDQSKTYLNTDLKFVYTIPSSDLNVDFYSAANDTMDGHFVLMINPDEIDDPSKILNKRVLFLLDNSSNMYGYKLDQSKQAITQCLDLLSSDDFFNLVTFNYNTSMWQNQLMPATAVNIQAAKNYISSVNTGSGSNLELALEQCLTQFPDQNLCNSILLFTDGFSVIDPKSIEQQNTQKAGIFSIGIGDNLDRAKLEMTSLLNYGFVTYFGENDNLIAGITRVFSQVNKPVLTQTNTEFGLSNVYDVLPHKIPTIYQGSRFYITGRYENPGRSAFSVAGYSYEGQQGFNFMLDFSDVTTQYKFAQQIWAKEMIDDIERQIAVYGETDSLKNLDIELSMRYNIRCKYTAYVADYETRPATTVSNEDQPAIPRQDSFLIANYPNPFNSMTKINFFLANDFINIKEKFIRIYNILGQLVAVIDISHLSSGFHTITFNALDYWGNSLQSGVYICQLVVGKSVSTIRIIYLR